MSGAKLDGVSAPRWRNVGFVLSVTAVAFIVGRLYNPQPSQAPLDLLQSLARVANKPVSNLTVALGYNVCVDAVLKWDGVLAASEAVPNPGDVAVLSSEGDVYSAFKHFFAAGAAAERTCDPAVFAGLVERAGKAADVRRTLGGNAALMARKLATAGISSAASGATTTTSSSSSSAPGTRVLLGGHVGPVAASLLPPSVTVASPVAARDEVHLILEYGAGEALDGAAAPRANRFIVTADESNQNAGAMLSTIAAADAAGADVLVVAGLHMMEPLPPARRSESLAAIAAALSTRATPFTVHIELASLADAGYMAEIASVLFPLADSVGFNEQEAAFLHEALGGTYTDAGKGSTEAGGAPACPIATRADVASTRPLPAAVGCLLRRVFQRFPSSLSRLHYHSLGYHVIAYRTLAVAKHWRGNGGANAAGALAATTEACRRSAGEMPADAITLVAPLLVGVDDPVNASASGGPGGAIRNVSSVTPVVSWKWPAFIAAGGDGTGKGGAETITFTLAPVPVCRSPVSTVGLGDAISAAALAADAVRVSDGGSVEASLEAKWPLLRYVPGVIRDKVARIAGRLAGIVKAVTGGGQ